MKKIRIGMDAKRIFCNKTGLGNYGRTLVENICQYYDNCQPVLYTPRISNLFNNKVEEYNLEVITPKGIYKTFHSLWRSNFIKEDLYNNNLDIYHGLSHEIPYGLNRNKIKVIVTIHDLIYLRYPHLFGSIDRKIYHYKFQYACKNADFIIAISQQTADDIVDFFHIDPSKITVLYQSCNKMFYEKVTDEKLKEIKKKYDLPDKFILNVGTLEERKNALTIIKAIKQLKESGDQYMLVIVGTGNQYKKKIESFIKENQLENQVKLLGRVEYNHLPCLYRLATLFIYPSLFEGFGIPIIEAMVNLTPIITSKGSCFSEVAGPNSCYIEALDSHDLAVNIKKIMEDKSKQNEMIEKGLSFVHRFSHRETTSKIIDFYNMIARDS